MEERNERIVPGVVRMNVDRHVGHASVTPNPFHQTNYVEGSSDVFVNGSGVVRKGDKTACGDPAVGTSPNVKVNGILVHRLNDATGGHGSWVPNSATTSSGDVIANGGGGSEPSGGPSPTTTTRLYRTDSGEVTCKEFNWNTGVCETGEI